MSISYESGFIIKIEKSKFLVKSVIYVNLLPDVKYIVNHTLNCH